MPPHLLAGSLLFRRCHRREALEQGRRCGNILVFASECWGARSLLGNFVVDLARVSAGESSIGVAGELTLEHHAFLLQLELCLLELLLASEELSPLLAC